MSSRLSRAWNALLGRDVAERAGWAQAWLRGDTVPRPFLFDAYTYGASPMQVSAISACVRLIAGNVAKLPFHAFRRSGENRRRERGHPLETLLNVKPNSWQTAHEFRRMMTAHVALHGNAFALKRGSGARIEELIPWKPENVKVIQDSPFDPPMYELRESARAARTYQASDILHLRDLTLDGVVGLSRIEQARQGINLALAAETYATAYFMNGAESGAALETDKNLSEQQRKSLIESWKEAHQGAHRAHVPTVLEGGLKIKQTSITNKDSQFLELRSFQVEDIARLYGVPPHLVGQSEKQTSWGTGVEQMAIGFLQFHLLDWLVMWETAVARDVIDAQLDDGIFGEHLVEGLLRADFKTRMDAYALAIQNGILSRNEARQKENMAPYAGGDEYLFPANMTKASEPVIEDSEDEARFPSDDPMFEWKKRARAAARVVLERKESA